MRQRAQAPRATKGHIDDSLTVAGVECSQPSSRISQHPPLPCAADGHRQALRRTSSNSTASAQLQPKLRNASAYPHKTGWRWHHASPSCSRRLPWPWPNLTRTSSPRCCVPTMPSRCQRHAACAPPDPRCPIPATWQRLQRRALISRGRQSTSPPHIAAASH